MLAMDNHRKNPVLENLDAMALRHTEEKKRSAKKVLVCAGTGCVANGALKIIEGFKRLLAEKGMDVETLALEEGREGAATGVAWSGCQGFCQMGPLVTIVPDEILYVKVSPEDVGEIVERTLIGGELVERLLYRNPSDGKICRDAAEIPFYMGQTRIVLDDCGRIDPENLSDYLSNGGYASAVRAYFDMTEEDLVELMKKSGLRGRGGGGFPTGRKWGEALKQSSAVKYVICNGDEGDPGAFMDRSLMEGNPHRVIEGVMIAGRAIGASESYIYVRAEYPMAVKRVRKAVADALAAGILGADALGSGRSFHCHVMEGAGAFVCGEETALIASVEGKRGMPSPKPPFPAERGLFGMPTVINNVETLAYVPLIVSKGAEWFRSYGSAESPGTKTFAITGHVANTGLIEVPFGETLGRIVMEIGGGVCGEDGSIGAEEFKAVQIGGPSGACLTKEHLDMPLDFESLKKIGAMVGSGGLVVMNKSACMVSVAKFFMQFTQNESCGKCVPCREGTKQILALLDDICEGRADAGTLPLLEELALCVSKTSLCGLGKTAPNPVLSTLRNFRAEYEAHVFEKRCPAGACKALRVPSISPVKCKGCGICLKKCPVGAISGERKSAHRIDPSLCVKCGACIGACKFNAITI